MTNQPTLAPCPFCGGKAVYVEQWRNNWIECRCGCRFARPYGYQTIAAWNSNLVELKVDK